MGRLGDFRPDTYHKMHRDAAVAKHELSILHGFEPGEGSGFVNGTV